MSPEEAARMRARIAELEAEVAALQSKVNEMNYVRGDTSSSSEKGSGGGWATGDAEAADAERLRIMRELVERDTGSDSVIMKRLAAELVATDLNANASAASLSAAGAPPPPQNSIQQAAGAAREEEGIRVEEGQTGGAHRRRREGGTGGPRGGQHCIVRCGRCTGGERLRGGLGRDGGTRGGTGATEAEEQGHYGGIIARACKKNGVHP